MPLVIAYKGKEKSYLIADNCQFLPCATIVRKAPRQFHIQKFKNFVIAYHGSTITFQKLTTYFDLNELPKDLTKGWLLRNFYTDFLDFLTKEADCKYDDEALVDCDFCLYIMGENCLFDISSEYLYEVSEVNASGDDDITFKIYHYFKDRFSDEELINLMIEKTVKYSYSVKYPFICVSSDDLNTLKIINEDGSIEEQKLERTFIDKVFAICDYYEKNESLRNSRHIYDLYKISKIIDMNSLNLKELVQLVRNERKNKETCLSAKDEYSIDDTLIKIKKSNFYKSDYDSVTKLLLHENVDYETAIEIIEKIIVSKLFS